MKLVEVIPRIGRYAQCDRCHNGETVGVEWES